MAWRHDLLRARRAVARHRRRRRACEAAANAPSRGPGRHDRLRHRRSATCRCASGSPRSTASTCRRCIVTNGSMQADAFLFDALVGAGDAVIVEKPTYDRTLLGLRERGADIRTVELEPDGIDADALRALLEGGLRPKLAHIIPNFQNPAGYTLSREKRERAARARRASTTSRSSRTTPTSSSASAASRCRRCSRSTTTRPRRLRVVVLQDRLPRHPRRLPRRAGGADRADRQARDEHVHLAEHGRPVDRLPVLPRRADRRLDRDGQGRAAGARRRARPTALQRELPEARFQPPEGGYFMWVELPEGADVDAVFTAAAERGVAFVKGTDFLLEGGENTPAPRLLRRDARADRRGRQAPRRRGPRRR